MAAPCFEHQTTEKNPHLDPAKDKAYWEDGRLVVTPAISKAFYKEAKAWSDNGLTFSEIVDKMHKTSGLQKQTIRGILAADKTAVRMTDAMWYKQARYRNLKAAAERMVVNANTKAWVEKAGFLWNFSRAVETVWHGGVVPFTHAFSLAITPPGLRGAKYEGKIFAQMVADAYRYGSFRLPSEAKIEGFKTGGIKGFLAAPGKGEAAWAKDMDLMVGSDDWIDAVRHKVEAHPGDKPVGIFGNLAEGWGARTFDAIKQGRVRLYQLRKAQLKEFDDASLDMLGKEVNISTGALRWGEKTGGIAGVVSFAPSVFLTRRLEAFTPIRYAFKAGRMTQLERSAMNQSLARWGRHAVTALAILEGNDLYNKYFTKGKQRVNMGFGDGLTQPGTLFRMNIGGHIIPISPMVEVVRAPVVAVGALFMQRRELKGREASMAAWDALTRDFFNALHPTIHHMIELMWGHEIFGVPRHQARLPSIPIPGTNRRFPGVQQLVRGEDPGERGKEMSWGEYLGSEFTLIPVGDFVKEMFAPPLVEEGVPESEAKKIAWALFASGMSGVMGKHTFTKSPESLPQKTRYKRPMGTLGGSRGAVGALHE